MNRPGSEEEEEEDGFVTGVDVGTVNFGLIKMNLRTGKVVSMSLVNLRCWQDPKRSKEITCDELVQSMECVVRKNKHTRPFFSPDVRLVMIEQQMPGGFREAHRWLNMMIQVSLMSTLGPERYCVLTASEGKSLYPESFPILEGKTTTQSQRHNFNKRNAEELKQHVLDEVELEMINKFPKGRHHHLVDAWLMARCAYRRLKEHEHMEKNGLFVYL